MSALTLTNHRRGRTEQEEIIHVLLIRYADILSAHHRQARCGGEQNSSKKQFLNKKTHKPACKHVL